MCRCMCPLSIQPHYRRSWVRLPARRGCVVDQARRADRRRERDQDRSVAAARSAGLRSSAVAGLEVLGFDSGRVQGLGSPAAIASASSRGSAELLGSCERPRDRERRARSAPTGRRCDSRAPARRRRAPSARSKARRRTPGREPSAQDDRLLGVLLAEERDMRGDDVEELGDHGRHAVEMRSPAARRDRPQSTSLSPLTSTLVANPSGTSPRSRERTSGRRRPPRRARDPLARSRG